MPNLAEAIELIRERKRRQKEEGDTLVCDLLDDFAADSNEEAMIEAVARRLNGDVEHDRKLLNCAEMVWLLMDGADIIRKPQQ